MRNHEFINSTVKTVSSNSEDPKKFQSTSGRTFWKIPIKQIRLITENHMFDLVLETLHSRNKKLIADL